MRLVCTRQHYAGDYAEHPWDAGDGWSVEKAATLWTPNGMLEAAALARLASDEKPRLRDVLLEAAGER